MILTLWRNVMRKLTPPEVDANFETMEAAIDSKSPAAGPGPSQAFSVGVVTGTALRSNNALGNTVANEGISVTNSSPAAVGNVAPITMHLNSSNWGGTYIAAAVAGITENATTGAAGLALYTNADGSSITPTERARIDSSGNLLVGVTTQVATERLRVNSVNSFTAALVSTHNVSGDTCLYMEMGANTDNSSSCFINASKSGVGQRFYVLGNGNCQNINNSYGAISDLKLKENIAPARNYLEDICRVNVVKYSLKADYETTGTHLGVIAQELEEIFPGMIEVTNDTAERPSGTFEQMEITPAIYETIIPRTEIMGKDAEGNSAVVFVDREEQVLKVAAVMGDDETKPIMERYETGEITKGVKYSIFVPMILTVMPIVKRVADWMDSMLQWVVANDSAILELREQNRVLEERLTALEEM